MIGSLITRIFRILCDFANAIPKEDIEGSNNHESKSTGNSQRLKLKKKQKQKLRLTKLKSISRSYSCSKGINKFFRMKKSSVKVSAAFNQKEEDNNLRCLTWDHVLMAVNMLSEDETIGDVSLK